MTSRSIHCPHVPTNRSPTPNAPAKIRGHDGPPDDGGLAEDRLGRHHPAGAPTDRRPSLPHSRHPPPDRRADRERNLPTPDEPPPESPQHRTDRPPKPPKPPDAIEKKFGWMVPLAPQVPFFRGNIEALLKEPDMVALLATAPTTLGRPIRSLCWSLRLKPPPILARPRRPRPPKPPSAAAPAAERPAAPKAGRATRSPRRHLPKLPPLHPAAGVPRALRKPKKA